MSRRNLRAVAKRRHTCPMCGAIGNEPHHPSCLNLEEAKK